MRVLAALLSFREAKPFEGSEACVAPVLAPSEVETHPHTAARQIIVRRNGVAQPNVAPRFSRTPGEVGEPRHAASDSLAAVLSSWGRRTTPQRPSARE